MPRKASHRRFSLRAAAQSGRLFSKSFRRSFEPLEARNMLSAQDLLIGDLDDSSVLRYDATTDTPVPGGVPSGGDEGELYATSGVAVAPDGTYYVSSQYVYGLDTSGVLHYSSNGTLLDVVGVSDEGNDSLADEPGNLAFGPNGNLYVADLATSSIYQVDTATQQYLPDDTLTMVSDGYPDEAPVPGGFTFAANGDLIVGDIGNGSVANYHEDPTGHWTQTGYYIQPLVDIDSNDMADSNAPWLSPSSIIAESNGDLLISDLDFDYSSVPGNQTHHQVVLYDAATQTASQFINLTTPYGTENDEGGNYVGDDAQPETMLIGQDGNLLVAVSPDHAGNGAVQEYNINTGAPMGTLISGIGTPAGLAYIPAIPIVTPSDGDTGYTVGEGPVAVDAGLTLADANTTPDLSATITISGNYQSGDALNFANTANITGTVSSPDGVYTLTLTGSDTLANYQAALQSITFSSSSASMDQRTISFSVTDGTQTSVTATKEIDVSAPVTVSAVYVSGSAWTSASNHPNGASEEFEQYLSTHNLGSATLGYNLQDYGTFGGTQTTPLPWGNINQITVTFSGPVNNVGVGSLELVGGTGTGSVAAPTVTGVTTISSTTYTWSLSGSLGNNKYVFAIASTGSSFGGSNQVTDNNGAGISGAFATGNSLPSGSGFAGSTFDYFFNVMPGDVNHVTTGTSSTEVNLAKAGNNQHETSTSYNPFIDFTGAGGTSSTDVTFAEQHNNLHNDTITAPTAPSVAVVGTTESVRSTGFSALALGVLDTSGSTSSTTASTVVSNVTATSSGNTATTGAASTSGTSSTGSGGSTTTTTEGHGRHKFAAVDEAVSDFDLADLLA